MQHFDLQLSIAQILPDLLAIARALAIALSDCLVCWLLVVGQQLVDYRYFNGLSIDSPVSKFVQIPIGMVGAASGLFSTIQSMYDHTYLLGPCFVLTLIAGDTIIKVVFHFLKRIDRVHRDKLQKLTTSI